MHDFFTWILRDGLDSSPYVEFPAHQRLIVKSNLRGRIGRLGGDLLRIQKDSLQWNSQSQAFDFAL